MIGGGQITVSIYSGELISYGEYNRMNATTEWPSIVQLIQCVSTKVSNNELAGLYCMILILVDEEFNIKLSSSNSV